MKTTINTINFLNRILLGLLMLVPGLTKLLVNTPEGVSKMLSGIFLFAWAPLFWAWLLIFAEIFSGLAIIAKFKLKYSTISPVIILTIAVLFMSIKWPDLAKTSWSNVIFHLLAITNFLFLSLTANNKN